jgi:tetratricopeptide (TPR) repeat protein
MAKMDRATSTILIALAIACSQNLLAKQVDNCAESQASIYLADYEIAIKQADKCVAASGENTMGLHSALITRAYAKYMLTDYDGAANDQAEALRIFDSHYQLYTNYSLYLHRAGRVKDSLNAALVASKFEIEGGKPIMPIQFHLGWSYLDNGEPEKAVKAITAGIDHQPDFPSAYFVRGLAYEQLGETDKSRKDMQAAAELFQNGPIEMRTDAFYKEAQAKFIEIGIIDDKK